MKTLSTIDKYRLQASRLQKTVRQVLDDDSAGVSAHPIVQRLRTRGELNTDNEAVLRKRLRALPLGKYLDLLAQESGHDGWAKLSAQLREEQEANDDFADTELYKFNASEFNLNVWVPTYEEAREYLDTHRGFYLLQYKGHCFLAQAPHIVDIGLDPNDPDWEKIGRDWVKPKDPEAKQRLRDKLREVRERAADA